MGKGHHWGGAIEMAVCSLLKGVEVHVYEASGARYRRISSFNGKAAHSAGKPGGASRVVSLLYSGRVHYDALHVQRATLGPGGNFSYAAKSAS